MTMCDPGRRDYMIYNAVIIVYIEITLSPWRTLPLSLLSSSAAVFSTRGSDNSVNTPVDCWRWEDLLRELQERQIYLCLLMW